MILQILYRVSLGLLMGTDKALKHGGDRDVARGSALDPIRLDEEPVPSVPFLIPQAIALGSESLTVYGPERFMKDMDGHGIPLAKFKSLFTLCPSCKRVVASDAGNRHICDISDM